MRSRARYRRDAAHAVRREAGRLDQGGCPHVGPDELPCWQCFAGGES